MNSATTDAQRAVAMTSTHPPTNPILLTRWKYEASDPDLRNLVDAWMKYLTGKIKTYYYFVRIHDKVYEKIKLGFYNKKG